MASASTYLSADFSGCFSALASGMDSSFSPDDSSLIFSTCSQSSLKSAPCLRKALLSSSLALRESVLSDLDFSLLTSGRSFRWLSSIAMSFSFSSSLLWQVSISDLHSAFSRMRPSFCVFSCSNFCSSPLTFLSQVCCRISSWSAILPLVKLICLTFSLQVSSLLRCLSRTACSSARDSLVITTINTNGVIQRQSAQNLEQNLRVKVSSPSSILPRGLRSRKAYSEIMASPQTWLNLFRTMFLTCWVLPSSDLRRQDSLGASRSRWISFRMASSPSCPICSLTQHPTTLNKLPYQVLVSMTMQLCLTQFSRQRSQMFLICRLTFLFFLRQRQRWSRKQSPLRLTNGRLCNLFLMVMQLQSDCSLNCTLPSLRTLPLELCRHSPVQTNYIQIYSSPFMSMLFISLSASLQMQTRSQLCQRVERGCSGQLSSTSYASTFRKQTTSLPSLLDSTLMPRLVVLRSMSEIFVSFLVKDLSSLAEQMRKILNQTASSKKRLYASDLNVTKQPSSVLSLCRSTKFGANLSSSFEAYKNTGLRLSLRLCFSIQCSARMKQRQFLFSFLLVKVSFMGSIILWRAQIETYLSERSFQNSDGLIQQFAQSFSEDCYVLIDQIGAVEVALLYHEHQREIFLHDPQCYDLILLLILQFDVGFAFAVVMPVLVVEVGDVDEDIEYI